MKPLPRLRNLFADEYLVTGLLCRQVCTAPSNIDGLEGLWYEVRFVLAEKD